MNNKMMMDGYEDMVWLQAEAVLLKSMPDTKVIVVGIGREVVQP